MFEVHERTSHSSVSTGLPIGKDEAWAGMTMLRAGKMKTPLPMLWIYVGEFLGKRLLWTDVQAVSVAFGKREHLGMVRVARVKPVGRTWQAKKFGKKSTKWRLGIGNLPDEFKHENVKAEKCSIEVHEDVVIIKLPKSVLK